MSADDAESVTDLPQKHSYMISHNNYTELQQYFTMFELNVLEKVCSATPLSAEI